MLRLVIRLKVLQPCLYVCPNYSHIWYAWRTIGGSSPSSCLNVRPVLLFSVCPKFVLSMVLVR